MTDALAKAPPAILSPDDLRELLGSAASTDEPVLVDVRETIEFAGGHLDGAANVPFSELRERSAELTGLTASTKVFVCHSGVRSTLAARHAMSHLGLSGVHVLRGGLRGWEGREDATTLELDLRLAAEASSAEQYFRRVLELEVGSERLYRKLSVNSDDPAARSVLSALVDAERAHERAVHHLLSKASSEPVEPLADLLQHTPGNVLSSGEPLDSLLARLNERGDRSTMAILELALDIEFTAYHVYRTVAELTEDDETRATCLQVAREERFHANRVLRGMFTVAAR